MDAMSERDGRRSEFRTSRVGTDCQRFRPEVRQVACGRTATVVDGDGIKSPDGSFLHPRTHTFDPFPSSTTARLGRQLSRIEWTWDLPGKFATARDRVSSLDESGAIPETNHWKRADHRLAPTRRSVTVMAILMIDFKALKLRRGIHDSDWTRNRSRAGRC